MKLTREDAIREHRKMWNWIADKLVSMDKYKEYNYGPSDIKKEYLNQIYGKNNYQLDANCFLCEYISITNGSCDICPLDWGHEERCADNLYALFTILMSKKSYNESAEIARQIANLPERKEIKELKFTRKEAIEEHRKMWNWIADKLLSDDGDKYHGSDIIKKEYLNQKYGEDNYRLEANCFLCQYIYKNIHKTCSFCPLDWKETVCFHTIYPSFKKMLQEGHNKEAAAIARQIANLPEKKEG